MAKRRTTIELDEDLLAAAKRATNQTSTRATVEEGLRRLVETDDEVRRRRAEHQQRFWDNIGKWADLDVMASEEMWR